MAEKGFTEKQMRAFSKEAIPLLAALQELAKRHGVAEGGLRVYVSDKYLSIEGTNLEGWELEIYGKDPMMTLVYEKRVPVYEGDENDEI